DVPVLAVSGGLDLRTPTANAEAVVRQFPQGQLLVAPEVGHSVLSTDLSLCSQREVQFWVQGLIVHPNCPRSPPLVRTLGAFPRAGARRAPRSTLAVAAKTVRETEAAWPMTRFSSGVQAPRLSSGKPLG